MNASAFIGDFVRRFGCTVQVGGREFDAMGRSAEKGGACATCGECSRGYGDMGMAAEGVAIIQTINGLHLSWACPGCGRETVEDTTLFEAAKQASGCIDDGLCYSCRAKSYSKVLESDSKKPNGLQSEDCNPLISLENLAEWTGLEPATPGVTGRCAK